MQQLNGELRRWRAGADHQTGPTGHEEQTKDVWKSTKVIGIEGWPISWRDSCWIHLTKDVRSKSRKPRTCIENFKVIDRKCLGSSYLVGTRYEWEFSRLWIAIWVGSRRKINLVLGDCRARRCDPPHAPQLWLHREGGASRWKGSGWVLRPTEAINQHFWYARPFLANSWIDPHHQRLCWASIQLW